MVMKLNPIELYPVCYPEALGISLNLFFSTLESLLYEMKAIVLNQFICLANKHAIKSLNIKRQLRLLLSFN